MRARDLTPGPELDRPGPAQQAAFYVTRTACGEPLAYAEVALFGEFAALALLVSRRDRQPDSSWARYQLHTCLVLDLGSCGVTHLLTGSALTETAGTQYFQHLLGYQARNLRVTVITVSRDLNRVTSAGPGTPVPRAAVRSAGGRRGWSR